MNNHQPPEFHGVTVSVLSPSILEQCIPIKRFTRRGDWAIIEDMNVLRLNQCYRFYDVWVNPKDLGVYIDDPTCLVFNIEISVLVYWFRFFSLAELKLLCRSHGIKHGQKTKTILGNELHEHRCPQKCSGLVYIFKSLPRERRHVSKFFEERDARFQFSYIPPAPRTIESTSSEWQNVNSDTVHPPNNGVADEEEVRKGAAVEIPAYDYRRLAELKEVEEHGDKHLNPLDEERKAFIIREWQNEIGAAFRTRLVCAACAIQVTDNESVYVPITSVDLTLLRNDHLPPETLPTSYDFLLYSRAILEPLGLETLDRMGRARFCLPCHRSLCASKMPKFALSNWLYYGQDALPADARDAFRESSLFDKMLVCRARANTITCRFNTQQDDVNNPKKDSTLAKARKGIRGNVLVSPLDVVRMNTVIPPNSQSIRDTMCAVFIGKNIPTRDTLRRYSPILVRKSRVKNMIEFLLKYNSHYKPTPTFQFSPENLDGLFSGSDTEDSLPHGVHVGYMKGNDAIDSTVADYTPRNQDEDGKGEEYDELLMENVGYTEGDSSPLAYLSMKALALERCLQGKPFIASGTGSQMIPDFNNPSILTWLFPHLDPWGIGGFHHPGRVVRINMFDQLCHLLKIRDSPFQRDPEFAFVFHNVCRKALVAQSLRFTVSRNVYRKVAMDLLSMDPEILVQLDEHCRVDPYYRPQGDKEKSAFKVLSDIRTVSKRLPGSDGYKIMLRNEIRALINYKGTPTLFVTLNPSDVDHPLVRLLGGADVKISEMSGGEELSKWQRSLYAAKNPAACARFFDVMITQFIRTILRYGREDEGLYGHCTAYYGTVEAQGKGTLHCHMLIWLRGHSSPQDLKNMMLSSETYRDRVLAWMESVISCEFPQSEGVSQQKTNFPRRVLSKDTGDPHPGVVMPPAINNYNSLPEFWRDFNHFLERVLHHFAWHEHQATCWKYLQRGQAKTDENCRMGMDGRTVEKSEFDVLTNDITLRRHHPKLAPYTGVVSYLMQCNMDIKFVGSGEAAKAFLYYVTDYITKASLSVHVGMSALSYAVKKIYTRVPKGLNGLTDEDAKGAVITAVNSMMGRQEISQPQVMSYLIGGGDHYTSHKFVFLQWGAIRKHIGLEFNDNPEKQSINISDTGIVKRYPDVGATTDGPVSLSMGYKSITASSQYLDYIHRSDNVAFDRLCLYDFVAWTSKVCYRKGDRTECELAGAFTDEAHPQYTTHYLCLRRSCHVPVILGPTMPNPDVSDAVREDWSRDMLLLFKPWRHASELKDGHVSWSDAFCAYKPELSLFHQKVIKNMRALTECSEARDRHRLRAHGKIAVSDDVGVEGNTMDLMDEIEAAVGFEERDCFDPFRGLESEDCTGSQEGAYIGVPREILSDASSRLLDMCLPLKMEDIPVSRAISMSGQTSLVAEDDLPRISQHNAIMELKRKRCQSDDSDSSDAVQHIQRAPIGGNGIAERAVLQPGDNLATPYRASKMEYTVAEIIVDELQLSNNEQQLKAFNIVARQLIERRDTQLLMHVAGVGGTGKSHVIRAIVLLFERLGKRRELLLGAPTGIAAVLINGQTLHSLINLTPNGRQANITQLVDRWRYVKFLIVDEVSMIGARFLSQMSNRMRQGKGDDIIGRERPFGGVNVIFMGDFGQLKPPKQYALYANELINNPSFMESRNNEAISAMNGAFLWRQVRSVVELVKNQRHSQDPEYAAFLARLRVGECVENVESGRSDLDYLRTRLLENQANNISVLETFRDASVIVGSKDLRDLLNVKLVKYHARRCGNDPILYFSSDSVNRKNVDPQARERLWSLPSSVNREAFGRLPLFIGMKVMVTENLAFRNGIVNGSEGSVVEIKYNQDGAGRRYAKVVYIHIPGCGIDIDDLGTDVVPIFPVVTRIEHGLSSPQFKYKAFSRRQVPLVPAYAYTDYKSQGRTLSHVIVDLASARGQGVYVMLSRVRSLSGLLILRWFSPSKIYHRLSEELRTELVRIKAMASTTE